MITADLVLPPERATSSETTAETSPAPRGTRISLRQARKLALGAMERADQRWDAAIEAESQFFEAVLGDVEDEEA